MACFTETPSSYCVTIQFINWSVLLLCIEYQMKYSWNILISQGLSVNSMIEKGGPQVKAWEQLVYVVSTIGS